MGKIRTKTVKRAARRVVESYFSKLGTDFYDNKRLISDVTVMNSKKLRNKIAGYSTHLMKRLAKGSVRGVSLKLQEKKRERKLDFIPDISAITEKIQHGIQVDRKVMDMLKKLGTSVPSKITLESQFSKVAGKRGDKKVKRS